MYKRIMVPMEGEQHQDPALDHALQLAQYSGAAVLLAWLVPVVSSGEHFFTQVQVEPGSSGARRSQRGERFLSMAAGVFEAAGIEVIPKIVVSPQTPEQAILDVAKEQEVDLIVMSTLPQSAVGRFLFGNVQDKVRRHSSVPVLFVNSSSRTWE
jgi:nucleotide-binding universal stress UspA family protein